MTTFHTDHSDHADVYLHHNIEPNIIFCLVQSELPFFVATGIFIERQKQTAFLAVESRCSQDIFLQKQWELWVFFVCSWDFLSAERRRAIIYWNSCFFFVVICMTHFNITQHHSLNFSCSFKAFSKPYDHRHSLYKSDSGQPAVRRLDWLE